MGHRFALERHVKWWGEVFDGLLELEAVSMRAEEGVCR